MLLIVLGSLGDWTPIGRPQPRESGDHSVVDPGSGEAALASGGAVHRETNPYAAPAALPEDPCRSRPRRALRLVAALVISSPFAGLAILFLLAFGIELLTPWGLRSHPPRDVAPPSLI